MPPVLFLAARACLVTHRKTRNDAHSNLQHDSFIHVLAIEEVSPYRVIATSTRGGRNKEREREKSQPQGQVITFYSLSVQLLLQSVSSLCCFTAWIQRASVSVHAKVSERLQGRAQVRARVVWTAGEIGLKLSATCSTRV